jgi:hypothetical protein
VAPISDKQLTTAGPATYQTRSCMTSEWRVTKLLRLSRMQREACQRVDRNRCEASGLSLQ